MATVQDVAAYILQKQGRMSTMKLQKLCYYSQGYSLAWDEQPIFDEDFQAWANGPVCYELFKNHRGRFSVDTWEWGDASKLSDDEVDTVDAVLRSYGKLSGQQLSDKTHKEQPWLEARDDLAEGAFANTVISKDNIQDYFGSIVSGS